MRADDVKPAFLEIIKNNNNYGSKCQNIKYPKAATT